MKCPECKGVIEGQRSFCPHCGRKMGNIPLISSHPKTRHPQSAPERSSPQAAAHPVTIDQTAEQYIAAKLKGKEAQAAREALTKLKDAGVPLNIDVRVVKVGFFALVGAIVGSALPGHWGILGLFIGVFIGLQKSKKN